MVASVDHTDSTYRTQAAFGSTLRNRTLDQLFVLDEMERLNADPASFLNGLVDTSRTAIVGYSMGGYGAVVTAGGALAESAYAFPFSPPPPLLDTSTRRSRLPRRATRSTRGSGSPRSSTTRTPSGTPPG